MSDLVVEIGDQTVRCPAELDQRYEFGRNPGDLCLTVNGQPDLAMSRIVGVFMFTNTGWRILNPAGDGNTPRPNLSVTSPNVRAIVEAGGNQVLEGSGQIVFTATTLYTIKYQIENQEPAQAPNGVHDPEGLRTIHVRLTKRQTDYLIAMCGPEFAPGKQGRLTFRQLATLYYVQEGTPNASIDRLRDQLRTDEIWSPPQNAHPLEATHLLIAWLIARGTLTQTKWDQRFGKRLPDSYLQDGDFHPGIQ